MYPNLPTYLSQLHLQPHAVEVTFVTEGIEELASFLTQGHRSSYTPYF
jgi:hypothetical protein